MHSKYGGSVIKRYSVPINSYSTSVEVRLKLINVVLLPASKLIAGGEELKALETIYTVQLSKRKTYLDLKKRIVDSINALS